MKQVEIAGVIVEVDEERTADLQHHNADWCQCDGCTNARMERGRAMSDDQKRLLSDLGLNFREPFTSAYSQAKSKESPQHLRRNTCWLACGRIIGAKSTPIHRFDKHNWMWVESRREEAQEAVQVYPTFENIKEEGLIYILASNSIPRLYGEVCGFRSDYVEEECPDCGSRWRETGYLKPRSRIPDWRGVPELNQVLRDGRQRVYIELCSHCGRMEHRIVENRKPFRVKNTLYRDEMRARHPQ
jgi:hypothetical protein